jgi:hypothetical protein
MCGCPVFCAPGLPNARVTTPSRRKISDAMFSAIAIMLLVVSPLLIPVIITIHHHAATATRRIMRRGSV